MKVRRLTPSQNVERLNICPSRADIEALAHKANELGLPVSTTARVLLRQALAPVRRELADAARQPAEREPTTEWEFG